MKETFREFLIREHNDIKCNAGGTCCPDSCKHKTAEGKCKQHPSILGQEIRDDLRCSFTPMEVAANCAIACLPAISRIEKLTGEKIKIVEGEGKYQGQPLIEIHQHDRIMESFVKN
jgi:hypothetical protein